MKYIKPETTITTAVLSTIIMGSNKEQGKVNPGTVKEEMMVITLSWANVMSSLLTTLRTKVGLQNGRILILHSFE